jgi:ribosomal protein S12 methylthiotransferase accessory factor
MGAAATVAAERRVVDTARPIARANAEDVEQAPEEAAGKRRRARVLLVGLEPWGVTAALDLAAAGVGALHLLDDREIADDDLDALDALDGRRAFREADRGSARAPALTEALARRAPGCAVSWGPLAVTAGRPLAAGDTRWDLVLSCVPGDDLVALQAIARFAQAAGLVSLSASLQGLFAVVGPAVIPGRTACWECARLRRLAAGKQPRVEHAVQAALLAARAPRRERTYLAPMLAALGHLAALSALDVLESAEAAPAAGSVLFEDLVSLELSRHPVLPVPWCEICGGAAGGPVDREPRARARRLDEAASPAELRRLLAGVVDARTGIVTEILLGSQDSPHVVDVPVMATAVVGAYAACALHDHEREPDDGSGKGLTVVEAMISAVGEAVERYSAGRVDPRRIVRAPAAALTDDFIAPARLCLYADHQYDEPGFPFVRPAPEATIDWTLGAWLDTGEPVYLPALTTFYDYPARPAEHFCQVTSNGLAAGPTLAEAALRATLELVERDTFTLSWLGRLPARRIAVDASLDPAVRDLARRLAGAGRMSLYLLDAGLHVPVVMCVVFGDGARWPGATAALAAHPSPRLAVRKAILEQGQGGPYYRRLLEEGRSTVPAGPDDVHTLLDHALYYFPPERASAFDFLEAGPLVSAGDLAEPEPGGASLSGLVERLRAAGMRVAVADLSSPDLAGTPFRVARALGPDFQQIHFGHRLARLGNPRLGAWAPRGINPDPHPLD